MNIRKAVVTFTLSTLFYGYACAQSTLGDILDKGARKISKEDWIAMLPITSSGAWPDGQGYASITYKRDGTISGTAQHYGSGTNSGAHGTWTIDESGKVCVDEQFYNWPTSHQECNVRFKLGDEFFRVPSESDRNVNALKHTLKK